MLNYNLNIISPLQQEKKNEDIQIPIFWTFETLDSTDLGEAGYASMSIYAPNSNALGIVSDSNGNFDTDAQFFIRATLSGSNWPVTGSTTMSIFTSGITYDPLALNQYYFSAFSASAVEIAANPSITGSVIQNAYSASEFYRFFNDGRVIHAKGNGSNSIINWKVSSSSETEDLEGNQTNINGVSSSFELKKDIAVMVYYPEVTASLSGSYPNNYSLNQTASITSNVNNTTGSVTMSIVVPESGINVEQKFFNETTSTATLTASFVAFGQAPFNVTASIINNKGNISNSNINWYVTGSAGQYLSSSSLNITKDTNVTMVSQSLLVATGSIFTNDYAFNQTASLRSNYRPYLSNDSSSFKIAKINLEIPEIAFTSSQWISASCATQTNIITASFKSQVSIPQYNISASLTEYSIPVFTLNVTASGGGGGGGATSIGTSIGGGGGGGMAVSSSIIIVPNVVYNIYVGSGSAVGQNGDFTYVNGYNNCPNVTYNMFAGGGQAGGTGPAGSYINGGDSGIGYIVEGSLTSSFYSKFSGGTGSINLGPFPITAAGGGASNSVKGGDANASGTQATQGGDGANGFTAGGGGALATSGPTPPGPGRPGINGTGTTGQGGIYNSAGQKGAVYVSYIGSGSRFTATNAVVSYNAGLNQTTYTFNEGTGSFAYIAQPTI